MEWNALLESGLDDGLNNLLDRREQEADFGFVEELLNDIRSRDLYNRVAGPTLKRGTAGSLLDAWSTKEQVLPKTYLDVNVGEHPNAERISTTSLLSIANAYAMESETNPVEGNKVTQFAFESGFDLSNYDLQDQEDVNELLREIQERKNSGIPEYQGFPINQFEGYLRRQHSESSFPLVLEVAPENLESVHPISKDAWFVRDWAEANGLSYSEVDEKEVLNQTYTWEEINEYFSSGNEFTEDEFEVSEDTGVFGVGQLQEIQVGYIDSGDINVYVPAANLEEIREEYSDSFGGIGSIEARALIHEEAMSSQYSEKGTVEYNLPHDKSKSGFFGTYTDSAWYSDPNVIDVSGLPVIRTKNSIPNAQN